MLEGRPVVSVWLGVGGDLRRRPLDMSSVCMRSSSDEIYRYVAADHLDFMESLAASSASAPSNGKVHPTVGEGGVVKERSQDHRMDPGLCCGHRRRVCDTIESLWQPCGQPVLLGDQERPSGSQCLDRGGRRRGAADVSDGVSRVCDWV